MIGIHSGPIVAERDGLKVLDCQLCGYAHLDPLPDATAVDRYYADDDREYSMASACTWMQSQNVAHRRGLWATRYRFERDLIMAESPLLDVGAGLGHFVAWWNANVGMAYGLEPSATARRSAASPLVVSLADLPATFRTLRFCLVLEHLHDPVRVLKEYVQLLQPGGRVVVIVPNEFNPLQQRLRTRLGNWFVDPRHLNYFTPVSLRRLLQCVGLTVKTEAVTFPTELWRLCGCNSERSGGWCHWLRLQSETIIGPRLFRWYQYLYNRYGWGREIIMVAVNE